MAKLHKLVIFYCFILFGIIHLNNGQNDVFYKMKRLFGQLLDWRKYNKMVVPVGSDGQAVKVTFNLDIKRLIAFNTETQVLSLDAVISMMWFDHQLAWDPKEYADISMIRLPSEQVWQPDIILYNSADQFKGLPSGDIKMVIMFNGFVVYSPLIKTNTFCSVKSQIPKRDDIVTCSLKFGSWAYDGLAIDIVPAGETYGHISDEEYDVDLTSLEAGFNRDWELMSAFVKRNVIVYPFSPEPYIDITYKLMLKYKGN